LPDKIKVDRAFVSDLSERNERRHRAGGGDDCPRARMTTTAEEVETRPSTIPRRAQLSEVQVLRSARPSRSKARCQVFTNWVPGKTLAA
jgi:predicted signal transduction protein with EAL and GGDEF domain